MSITADHGMVDVPHDDRLDLARRARAGRACGTSAARPRALHLYCEPGAGRTPCRPPGGPGWGRHGDRRAGRRRCARGWFGPVGPRASLPRIGDVVVSAISRVAVVDSHTARPELLRLIGQHGARTPRGAAGSAAGPPGPLKRRDGATTPDDVRAGRVRGRGAGRSLAAGAEDDVVPARHAGAAGLAGGAAFGIGPHRRRPGPPAAGRHREAPAGRWDGRARAPAAR